MRIHELIEEQARGMPDAVAVVSRGEQLSYGQMDRRANQLARYLIGRGAGPEEKIGICLERGIDMIVALLGILKSGAAYVPMEPAHPKVRLLQILDDLKPVAVVTTSEFDFLLCRDFAAICIDRDWDDIALENTRAVGQRAESSNLAYVIFTSGSTGKPKGAMISHEGLVNYLLWCAEAYRVKEGCGSIMHSPLSFDLTVTSLYAPLMVGKTIVLVPESAGIEGLSLEMRKRDDLSFIKITPSHLDLLSQLLPANEAQNHTRALIIGGEALTGERLKFWQAYAPGTRLINEYGPTETVVGCCVYEVSAGENIDGAVPIGRPIASTPIYILDERLDQVGAGATGELCIGGVAVGRGYLNQPELTAEQFIPDPFTTTDTARLYRTGDMARYLPDGNIEFLGRRDYQVKIRGYRIEMAEIEAVLCQQESVKEAVVVEEDSFGEKRLVGYVVSKRGEGINDVEMKRYLSQRLPEYMVPSWIIVLDEMPLTANGKIDRKALPAPSDLRETNRQETEASKSAIEEIIAGIWADVLGVKDVGMEENFFELGGHSLMATRVISRVREVLGVEISLRTIFERPTVTGLAQAAESAMEGAHSKGVDKIEKASREGEKKLSYAQARLWVMDQLMEGGSAYNVPAAMRLMGRLNRAALEQSIREIIRRHEVLRTVIVEQGGEPRQQVRSGGEVSIEEIDISQLPEEMTTEQVERLVRQESSRGFDLARGPLMRVKVIKQKQEQQVLAVTMHHIVTDGWSMSVMVEEMRRLYEAYSRGEESGLEELKIQYADYAQWQREQEQSEIISRQIEYWKGVLGGELPVLEMGGKSRNRQAGKLSARRERLELGGELNEKIERMSRSEGVTKFMMMEAAFKVLLQRYSGQEDLIVGTVIANRRRAEVEGLIGFFVNTVALRSRVEGRDKFEEVLRREREVCLGAYTNQDAPFEKVVEEVAAGRDHNRSPLFQVMFVFQNSPQEEFKLSDVVLDANSLQTPSPKFDLVVTTTQTLGNLIVTLEYDSEVYDEREIKEMAKGYKRLLEGIVEDGGKRIDEYRMIDEQEADGYKAVDFSGAELSQKDFENLIAALSNHIH